MLSINWRTYILTIIYLGFSGYFFTASAQTYNVKPLKVGKGSEQVFASDFHGGLLYYCSNARSKQAKNVINEDNTRFLNLYQLPLTSDLMIIKKAKPQILSESINSTLNEGPICFDPSSSAAFFSSNVKSDSTQISLKVFTSNYNTRSSSFSPREIVELRLGDGNYSNPTISENGDLMIFSYTSLTDSTSDLYSSMKKEGKWGPPVRLEVNTPYTETFPRICGNLIYFASDRPDGYGGLDIYKGTLNNGEIGQIELLPEPVNSSFDDFLFFEVSGSEGFFSSNRQNGIDRIFKFKRDLPNVSGFIETKLDFCYTLQDEILLDKGKYDYMWEFGDGTKKNGPIVEHCYKDTGTFHITCHLMDVEELTIEENIIDGMIEVFTEYPTIEIMQSESGKLSASLNQDWSRKVFTNHYWIVDGTIVTNETLELTSEQTKPNTIKAVVWDASEPNNAIGIIKSLSTE